MGFLEVVGFQPVAARPVGEVRSEPEAQRWPESASVQLTGANAISSMFDPGYGLKKYLPDLLGLGPDGRPPDSYKTIAGGRGNLNSNGRYLYDKAYLDELALSFQFVVSFYGRDVQGFNMFMWKDVGMNGLTVVSGFALERTREQAVDIWRKAYQAYGLTSKPNLTIASGNFGWTTLETGWQLIASPEGKVIWQVSVDSPSYPKDEEPNEAAVLLMVAHPAYESGRAPLAYFSSPAVVPVRDAKREQGESARVAALRQAVQRLCAQAKIEPKVIKAVATDCGRGSAAASKRLSEVSAALHGLMPDLDLVHERLDMAALLGELGANTVNYTLLIAAYAAHQRNYPVLYLSNVDPDAARAMLVFPPLEPTPPTSSRSFREHHARGQWYAPWWGRRLDGKLDY